MIGATFVRFASVSATTHSRRPLRGLFPMFVAAALCLGPGCASAHESSMSEELSSAGAEMLAAQPLVEPVDGANEVDSGEGMITSGSMPTDAAEQNAAEVEGEAAGSIDSAAEPDGQTDEASEDGAEGMPEADDTESDSISDTEPDADADSVEEDAPAAVQPSSDTDAESEGDPEGAEGEGEAGPVIQVLETGQEKLSRTVVGLSRAMDRMLGAREVYPDELYDSILRVRFIQRVDDSGGSRLEPRVSGRLSLPGAEERWSVIFFSDDYEDPVDRERGTDRELDEQTRGSIALRYLRPLRDNAQTSLSVGLRTGPIDTILRARLWYEFSARKLSIRPEQTLFWYDERGLGTSTWLRLEYPLPGLNLLRSESGATWFRRDEQFYYDQVFSVLQPISKRRGLLWQIGMQAESEPNAHVTNYYAQVRWRSLVHRDWLVFELRPQLIRERDNDFHLERRIYVGFELLFGDPFRLR
jgi:hypothetical protein